MVKELAHMVGNALYSYSCSESTDRHVLVDLFRGLASSGQYLNVFSFSFILFSWDNFRTGVYLFMHAVSSCILL